MVIHTPVASYLDYCDGLYIELPSKIIWKVSVQNIVVQAAFGILLHPHYITALLSVGFWMQFKMLVTVYKALHDMEPAYFRNCLSPIISAFLISFSREDISGNLPSETGILLDSGVVEASAL